MTSNPCIADAFSCSQFAIDIEGYSRITPERRQTQVLRDLSHILDEAARSAHLDRDAWEIQRHGDGELTLIPATVRKANLVADYVRELVIELTSHNRPLNESGRLRVRVALHHGEARSDQGNFPGNPPIVVSRLLNTKPLKDALLVQPQAYLALILSDRMFEDTVLAGERGLDPADYTRVEIEEKGWKGIGWVTVPKYGAPTLPRTEDPRSGNENANVQNVSDNAHAIQHAYAPVTMGNSIAADTFRSGKYGDVQGRGTW